MKKRSDIPNQQVIFTFTDLPDVVLDISKVSDDVLEHAQYHGFEARIGDNAAIARKDKSGNIITVTEAMRREAVVELVNHYHTGTKDWALRGGPRAPAQSPTIAAIAAKLGITYAEAEAKVAEQMLNDMQ